jgi:serine/threonine-protein kinase
LAEDNTKNNLDRIRGIKIKNRYEILEKIASGGMSDVYLGKDLKNNKKVAVKILHESHADNRNFTARFKREAEILSNLNSPNVVAVYDWGKFEHLYFIIMEFVSGKSLKELIENKGALDPVLAAKYAMQICKALELAHSNNLIHRDIKPQNIMLSKDGMVKVTDFGIAKLTSSDITKTLSVLGTAHYISPEQAQGKILDNRSDIYSLGIVMYEMLSSDIPFRGGSSIDISLRHVSEKPQEPSAIFPEIPKSLEKIVMKCLEKNPHDRYQNVAILKSDLQNFLDGKPLIIEQSEINGWKKHFFRTRNNYIYEPGLGRDFEKYQLKNKKIIVGLISALCTTVIALIIFLTLYLVSDFKINKISESLNEVVVPELQNMHYESAKDILLNYGLIIETQSSKYSEIIPQNHIIDQSIVQGTEIEKDTIIYVTLSKGNENPKVSVPNLIGIEKEDALDQLEGFGLSEGRILEEYDDEVSKGIIIRQNPAGGNEVDQYTEIDLTVSKGRQLITLPDIKDYDYIAAKEYLESLNLIVNVKRKTDNLNAPGVVIATEPIAGSAVEINSIVTVFISTAQQLIEVPDLLNLDLEIAQQILASYDIGFEVNYIETENVSQSNSVIAQYPAPGEKISLEDSILLFIGQP